jgi:hypothetical protein
MMSRLTFTLTRGPGWLHNWRFTRTLAAMLTKRAMGFEPTTSTLGIRPEPRPIGS